VTLPPTGMRQIKIKQEDIGGEVQGRAQTLGRKRLTNLRRLPRRAQEDAGRCHGPCPDRHPLRRERMYPRPSTVQKLLAVQAERLGAEHIGNIYLLQERLDYAAPAYEASLRPSRRDTGPW